MFHDKSHGFKFDKYPGFLSIPYNTKLPKLKEYVIENTFKARKIAQEYIDEQKTKARIESVIQKYRKSGDNNP